MHFRSPGILLFVFVLTAVALAQPVGAQTTERDTAFHPYHINYWVTGGILAGGLAAEKIGIAWITGKTILSNAELQAVTKDNINGIDHWALQQDLSTMKYYVDLSDKVLTGIILLPALTMLDGKIRRDWLDILLLYAETILLTNNMYLYAPFGPTFQNKYRPVVYYDELGDEEIRTRGSNRSSMYSGHVASGASASFITAKIFCDYHPELGNNKYFVYAAASIPPLILSYMRLRALSHFPSDIAVGFGVGMLCGILIPEFHRVSGERTSVGVYSSFEGTGLRVQWRPY